MSTVLLTDLATVIKNRQAIIFVGSGVSVGATNGAPVASWVGLLRDGVARSKDLGLPGVKDGWCKLREDQIACNDVNELVSAADHIARKLGAPDGLDYRRWLDESIGRLKASDTTTIEALRDIKLPLITTNYDSLIEDVTKWQPVLWNHPGLIEKVLRGDDQGVIHLHGHWRWPNSVVLGVRTYEQILEHKHTQAILRALRTTASFIFIGFGGGLEDPTFESLREWSKSFVKDGYYRHFRLALESEVEALRAKHPPDEHLYIVPYGKSYSDLAPFLRSLTPQVATSP